MVLTPVIPMVPGEVESADVPGQVVQHADMHHAGTASVGVGSLPMGRMDSLASAPEMQGMNLRPSVVELVEHDLTHVAVDRAALPAMQKTLSKARHVPESWKDRPDMIGKPQEYARASTVVRMVESTTASEFSRHQHQEARVMGQLRDRNLASSHAVNDAFTVQGANPYAIDQLGKHVMKGFRIKAFSLMVTQCIIVLGIGILLDVLIKDVELDNRVYGGFFVCTIGFLFLVAFLRHKFPLNYILEGIFTVLIAVCLGFSTGPLLDAQAACCPGSATGERPAIYAFGFYTVGLTIMAVLSMFSTPGGKLIKCLPAAFIAMLIVNVIFIVLWNQVEFCPASWLVLMILIVSLCLLWVGFESDRLSMKLNIDEYLLPVILVWADLFILVAVCMLVVVMIACGGMDAGGGGLGLYCWGCHGCCDPWVRDEHEERRRTMHQNGNAPAVPV